MGANAPALPANKQADFALYLKEKQESFKKLLPGGGDLDERYSRFVAILWSNIRDTPQLLECTYDSLLDATLRCLRLGLEPGAAEGLCFLIPRRQGGVLQCNMEMGYKGLVRMLYQHPDVIAVSSHVVHEHDLFELNLGTEQQVLHKPQLTGPRGAKIGAYSIIQTRGGGKVFEFMTRHEIEEVKKSAQGTSHSSSPWARHESEMWRKTALKRGAKYAPLSTQAAKAITTDDLQIEGKPMPDAFGTADLTSLSHEPPHAIEHEAHDSQQ